MDTVSEELFIYFYPRPPRGGRHGNLEKRLCYALFLSTPSARRATQQPAQLNGVRQISSHALREEGDPACIELFCS